MDAAVSVPVAVVVVRVRVVGCTGGVDVVSSESHIPLQSAQLPSLALQYIDSPVEHAGEPSSTQHPDVLGSDDDWPDTLMGSFDDDDPDEVVVSAVAGLVGGLLSVDSGINVALLRGKQSQPRLSQVSTSSHSLAFVCTGPIAPVVG